MTLRFMIAFCLALLVLPAIPALAADTDARVAVPSRDIARGEIIGREREIQQMIEVLCHRERANSPMLVGESGVGKTAVVEGLARMIELDPQKVPARLRNSHIVQLQMSGIPRRPELKSTVPFGRFTVRYPLLQIGSV